MTYAEPPFFANQPDLPAPERSRAGVAFGRAERPWRSFLKAVSWRAAGSLVTTVIAYVVTGSLTVAVVIGMAEVATKTVLYYIHERLWTRVDLGVEARG